MDFLNQLARLEDSLLGWECEETKKLRLAGKSATTPVLTAEIRSVPVLGFGPRRQRRQVRLKAQPADVEPLPEDFFQGGVSLLEGDQPFGPPGGWRFLGGTISLADGGFHIWLED